MYRIFSNIISPSNRSMKKIVSNYLILSRYKTNIKCCHNRHLYYKNTVLSREYNHSYSNMSERFQNKNHLSRQRFPIEVVTIPTNKCSASNSTVQFINNLTTTNDSTLFILCSKSKKNNNKEECNKSDIENSIKKLGLPNNIETCLINYFSIGFFKGKLCETSCISISNENCNIKNAILVGIGEMNSDSSNIFESLKVDDLQTNQNNQCLSSSDGVDVGRKIGKLAMDLKAKNIIVAFNKDEIKPTTLKTMTEHIFVGNTLDNRFHRSNATTNNNNNNVNSNAIDNSIECLSYFYGISEVNIYINELYGWNDISEGIQLAKDLASAPPNFCTTEALANFARSLVCPYLKLTIYNEEDCIKQNMGAYIAVSQGSDYEPQFIHLKYKSSSVVKRRITLIGKSICMDTGGYNLKVGSGSGIQTMKFDMGGGAAVLATASVIKKLKPENIEIHFILPAAENMISSRAVRPGDIVVASNGDNIEIGNTDAEGRLTLADAIIYAQKNTEPDFIIDCATLTGAIVVGLGEKIAALYGNNPALNSFVLNSANKTGTALWPMPLYKPYAEHNTSALADIVNVSKSRYGGSITAALFLDNFVKEVPWCHIDMAGPVHETDGETGTGYGVSLLTDIILNSNNLKL